MAFQGALLSLFYTTFLENWVEAKASGPQDVLKVWLGVSNGILPAKYFHSIKSLF